LITTARDALSATVGDVILNRLDVLPSLDGVEHTTRMRLDAGPAR